MLSSTPDYINDLREVQHYRWWTRTHWRTLHRGTPQERTTFVTAHLKGPEAMPIKLPGYRVFAVTR